MARLILLFNRQAIKDYPLLKDSITIGRNEDNTIAIDNLAVSGHHARIDPTGSDFILTDLQSTNGTFVNDQKVVSHKLSHGDNVLIGKHIILFVGTEKGKAAPEPKEEKIDMDKTMMLDTVRQKQLLARQKGAAAAAKTTETIGMISFIGGSKRGDIQLTKKLTKIGKADTSEIKLSGLFMPATAATISRRPDGYTLTSTGGKIKINGQPVKDNVALKDFDTIELGSFKFQFYQREVGES